MVKVTVDTSKDSQEEILKAVEFLKTLVGSETQPEIPQEEVSVPMGMFDSGSSEKKEDPDLPEDINVLEY